MLNPLMLQESGLLHMQALATAIFSSSLELEPHHAKPGQGAYAKPGSIRCQAHNDEKIVPAVLLINFVRRLMVWLIKQSLMRTCETSAGKVCYHAPNEAVMIQAALVICDWEKVDDLIDFTIRWGDDEKMVQAVLVSDRWEEINVLIDFTIQRKDKVSTT